MNDTLMKIACDMFIVEAIGMAIALIVMIIVKVGMQLYENPRVLVFVVAFGIIIVSFVEGSIFCRPKLSNLISTLNTTINEITKTDEVATEIVDK